MSRSFAFLLLFLLSSPAARAADAPPAPGPEVKAVRTPAPIALDGSLADPAWQAAQPMSGFKQREPNEGAEPSQRTEVRVLYDDDALYVGARMFDAHPDSIVGILSRRDAGGARSDGFRVYLDPYFDRRSGYYFCVNAAGTLFDGTLYNDGWQDNSWDAVWEAKAKVDAEGWTAELRIPFSQLRFAKADQQKWGINFAREIARGFENDFLVYQPRNESGFVSRFPTLIGLERVSPGNSVELLPFVTAKGEFLSTSPDDPFNDGSRYKPNAGGDLRMALGDKLTLNATVNPDFGQVEVDPAVVNLSDVETFFPEKRPFFVEGSSIFNAGQQGASDYWGFNFPSPTFFYSRRIGHAPQGSLPDDAIFGDVPNGTTILGAGKISGKIGDGVNFGTLHALTSQEHVDLQMSDLSYQKDYEVEPLTYYGVARALKEFPGRRHGLGIISTLTARAFDDPRLEDEFNRASVLTAVDGWHFLDPKKTWVLSGWAGGTYVTGSETDLTSIQTSSRHYYQRPDATSYSLDPNATSLTGTGARVWLNKQNGNWISNSALGYLSPGMELNDLGFLSRGDVINGHVGFGYKWTRPTKHVKNHNLLGAVFGSRNFDGDLTSAGVWGSAFWWYTNNWVTEISAAYNPETVNPRRARGGPTMLNRPGYEFNYFTDTDGSRKRYYYISFNSYVQPDEVSWNWSVNPGITYKPVPNVSFQFGPEFARSQDAAYYYDAIPDPAATNTYGTRYLFTRLNQTTLSANIRLSVSFTPRMSLEFFGQPLISTGEYRDLRELVRPKSLDFVPSTYAEPSASDFNFKSLRGNAVFRWEYLPGSALYLVWTQERTDEQPTGEFDPGHDFQTLVNADANNIFLAKLTYYLPL